MRITIRGYADGCLLFAESLTVREAELEHSALAFFEAHRACLDAHPHHMLEIEFLDEPDIHQRYFRIGTDPAGMVRPVRVNLEENPS